MSLGVGKVGYVGDVNAEGEMTGVVRSMCGRGHLGLSFDLDF